MSERILITGTGIVCASGGDPETVWDAVCAGRSGIAPIRSWDASAMSCTSAAEVTELGPRDLVPERKTHKLLRRTDFLGLYAAERAIEHAGLGEYGDGLEGAAHEEFVDGTGVFAGAGGASYESQYEFFPALSVAAGDMRTFGREVGAAVHPMWLLRSLPNNVLCHVGIRNGFKGPNACVTNHCVSGALALTDAMDALRAGHADRAVAVAHDAPVEPQVIQGYYELGLLTAEVPRPFDAVRNGCVLGEGAAAVVVETAAAAEERGATVLGELLGGACTTEAEGLIGIRDDGDGLARAIELALEDARLGPADVGFVIAHGNATRLSDASEAAALRRVFGPDVPPVTALKWAFGHTLAACALTDAVVAVLALQDSVVPGIATLGAIDPDLEALPVSADHQSPRPGAALLLSRGFAATNAALLVGTVKA